MLFRSMITLRLNYWEQNSVMLCIRIRPQEVELKHLSFRCRRHRQSSFLEFSSLLYFYQSNACVVFLFISMSISHHHILFYYIFPYSFPLPLPFLPSLSPYFFLFPISVPFFSLPLLLSPSPSLYSFPLPIQFLPPVPPSPPSLSLFNTFLYFRHIRESQIHWIRCSFS